MPADVEVDADLEPGGETLLDDDSSGVGNRRGSLSAEISRAQSGTRNDGARSERNNRQATSDDFDPRSTLHRDASTFEDAELNRGDEFNFDVEGNPLDQSKPTDPPPGDPTQPEAEAPFDLFALAKAEGVDLSGKYKTPAEAAKGLLHAHRLVGQRNESAQQWEDLVNNVDRQRELYNELRKHFEPIPATPAPAAPQAPAPAAAAAAPSPAPSARPKPPTLPQGWKHHYVDGQPKPNADPAVIAQVEAVRADRLLQQEDPAAWHEKWFAAEAREAALKAFQEQQAELEKKRAEENEKAAREQNAARQFEQVKVETVNRLAQEGWLNWLYEPGYTINGSEIIGKLNADGEVFNRYLAEAAQAQQHGMPLYPHPYQRAMYARNKLIELRQAGGTAPTNGHAAPTPDPRLERKPGDTVGGTPRPAEYSGPGSLRQMLKADLRSSGASL